MSTLIGNLPFNADGWGPTGKDESDIPCHAFKKEERFGRPIEWWGGTGPRPMYRNYAQTFGNAKDFDEDTSGFTFVDSGKQQVRPGFRRPYNRGRGQRGRGQDRGFGRGRFQMQQRQAKFEKNRNRDKQNLRRAFVHRSASVEVKPNWKVIHQFVLADLAKLECPPPTTVTDIKQLGNLEYYEAAYDKVNLKQAPKLEKCDQKSFYSVTSTMDPVIREISNEVWEEASSETATEKKHHIFATDTILATLMSCARSVNSWDLRVDLMDINGTKVMFLDKREDYETHPVNETSREAPTGEQMQELAEELALVNQQFSQQILKKPPKPYRPPGTSGKNPFSEEGEDAAPVLYKYRKWKLTNDITLVARCSVDGVTKTSGGKDALYKAYSLLEYDAKATNWRQKLETSAGAVLATEIKNNACLVAKWTAQAVLSGAEQMKIGFVARTSQSNRLDHQVLGCQSFNPMDFALNNIALNPRQMWALLRSIVEHCIRLPEGSYVIMRDPNKGVLFLYSLPPEENEDDEDQAEGEDSLGQNVMAEGSSLTEAVA